MSYSSFEKDKRLMENWRKFSKEQLIEQNKNMVKDPETGKLVPDYAIDGEGADDLKKEKEQLDEALPALVPLLVKALPAIATGLMFLWTNSKAIGAAAKVIGGHPKCPEKLRRMLKSMETAALEADGLKEIGIQSPEDLKDPNKIAAAIEDKFGQEPGMEKIGLDPDDDIPPGLE